MMSPKRAMSHVRQLCALGLTRECLGVALVEALHDVVPHLHARFVWCDDRHNVKSMYCEVPEMYDLGRTFFEHLDNRLADFPSTRFFLSRGAGVGHYLPIVSRPEYFRGRYHNEIERPAGGHHFLDVVIGDNLGTLGAIILTREQRARAFSSHDIALLGLVLRYAAYGLRVGGLGDDLVESEEGPEWVLADAEGHMQSTTARARLWLGMAFNPSPTSHSINDTWISTLPQSLARVCRELCTAPPAPRASTRTLSARNAWGGFLIQVQGLHCPDPTRQAPQVAISLRRFESQRLQVMRKAKRLGLSPAQTAICLRLACSSDTEAQIAQGLGIGVTTVHDHVSKIYTRLGLRSREALTFKLAGPDRFGRSA